MIVENYDYILEGATNKNAIIIDIKVSCPLTSRFDHFAVVRRN